VLLARTGVQQNQTANQTFGNEASEAFNQGQGDISQFNQNTAQLQAGKNVGADPYLNPQYLAAVNQMRSGALNQNNNAADQKIRATQAKTGGMNSTATTGAIAGTTGATERLGNELGAQQTAQDWQKNVGYQLNLAQQPLMAARAQSPYFSGAVQGQGDALKNLTQYGLAQYGPWMSAIQAGGAAGAAALS